MTRILFVDDDEFVLHGLRRLLTCTRDDWDVEFATGGPAALEMCVHQRFDVIVSDMRMPEMDGAELLTEISHRFPDMIRIILSGQSDREAIFRAVGPAHQYLAKPCTLEKLEPAITRACKLRDRLDHCHDIQAVVSQVRSLPSLPSLVLDVIAMLKSTESSIEEIGRAISKDVAMSTKVLQLVNSSFFGSPTVISDIPRAVTYLGLKLLKPLVLSAGIFSHLGVDHVSDICLSRLMTHSAATGLLAREIALSETGDVECAEQSMVAGLLKDIGLLILGEHFPKRLRDALEFSGKCSDASLAKAEVQIFGVNHGETGAYLLGLWGLPCPIVEAVAYHQIPQDSVVTEFCPLVALHAASIIEQASNPFSPATDVRLDIDFLARFGKADRFKQWEKLQINPADSVDCHV